MRYGYHLSIRGGYHAAARAASAAGLSAYQYFPKNPRSLTPKAIDYADGERCASFCREHGIVSIAHSPYPTNLAAGDEEQVKKTTISLLNDLAIADSCGSVGVVVHFGIYKGRNVLDGYRNIIYSLNLITSHWSGKAKLLIENQAGDHAFMGTTMEELAQIRGLCKEPDKIAYCLDTCHLFASGTWNGEREAQWADKARQLGVMSSIAAVHLNDSLHPAGMKRDRHAALGQGHIPVDGMKWLVGLPELAEAAIILETPPDEDGTYNAQLNLIREWGD
ncbi:deoxyribonuclease IV [Paenibacillus sp. GCM10023252]|uniref:deoxyribonuclease IV n=1 Tax=Paenibacillus sp. GCM10023252 TaxID=3252649 RepID=UPI003613A7A2